MIAQMWRNKNIRVQAFAFLLLFFSALLLSALLDIEESRFRWDALGYWSGADETLASGSFRILDFSETFRGYLLPVLNLGLKIIFHGVWGWRVFSALQIAIIFSVLLPFIYNLSFSVTTLLRVFVAELFFFYVWGNLAQYPLSDLPAIFFFLIAICLCKQKCQQPNLNSPSSTASKALFIIGWLLAGVFFYAAYNTRVVYLYAIIIFLAFHMFTYRKKFVLISMLCIFIGMLIPAIPQCMINYKHVGKFSPKVYAVYRQSGKQTVSLQNKQLFWGVTYPKYETYVGDVNKYPSRPVYFDDRVGQAIVQREQLSDETFSPRSLIRLFVKYPLDMVGIYTRHLIAVMTPTWRETYISNIRANKVLLVLSSIVLWLISGLHMFSSSLRCSDLKQNAGYFVAIVAPALLSVPGATEVRYFLPAYLMLYGLVFLKVSYHDLFRYVMANKLKIVSVLSIIMILWISLLGTILAMNREQAMLFSGY